MNVYFRVSERSLPANEPAHKKETPATRWAGTGATVNDERLFASTFSPTLAEIKARLAAGLPINGIWAMASAPKPFLNITDKADKMPRNACLLYKNHNPKDAQAASYRGVVRLEDGQTFWVGAWPRTVKGETVIELRFSPKN
jgi:hypothetical protein